MKPSMLIVVLTLALAASGCGGASTWRPTAQDKAFLVDVSKSDGQIARSTGDQDMAEAGAYICSAYEKNQNPRPYLYQHLKGLSPDLNLNTRQLATIEAAASADYCFKWFVSHTVPND
jgi:hypothetical protein